MSWKQHGSALAGKGGDMESTTLPSASATTELTSVSGSSEDSPTTSPPASPSNARGVNRETWQTSGSTSKRQRERQRRNMRRSMYDRLVSFAEEGERDRLAVPAPPPAALSERSSVMLPSLEEWERRFFELVAAGEITPIREFLDSHPDMNINCIDYQGLSALHLAVRSGDVDVTELLLSVDGIEVGDCALHAAQMGNTRILHLLLDKLAEGGVEREFAGCVGSPDFPDGTTPLLLAAQEGNYDAIALLLARGHTLTRPHPPYCKCPQCMEEAERPDRLATGTNRLGLYRAWVNPAFLCHSSDDPILDAFRLCAELRSWALEMSPLRGDFADLSRDVRTFAANLMGTCRTSREAEVLLRRRRGFDFRGNVPLPRLALAVDLVQKEFVANANTQLVLEGKWVGDWAAWRSCSTFLKALYVFPHALLLPVIALVYLFAPNSTWGRHFALPINKYLSHVASYMIFLVLVFAESSMDKHEQRRGPPNSGLEPVLILFVLGHIWRTMRLCFIHGPRRFFAVQPNWVDAVNHLLFASAFMFWGAAAMDVAANDQQFLERKYWHALDPTLVAEGLFALATILAFMRLLLLMQFSYHLGPLQVSLGKMLKDMARFVVVFAIVILSFAAGLQHLYQYYDGMTQHDTTGGSVSQVSSFVSLSATLKTLFWGIFCMSAVEVGDVVIEELPSEGEAEPVINSHYFTAGVGHVCFALFEVFSVIVLLNMLIATICNTFQKVVDNVDVEWTFGRTEMYMVYLTETVLPSPLNLIPTCAGMASVTRWCSLLTGGKGKGVEGEEDGPPRARARCTLAHCCFVEQPPPDEEEDRDYAAVMAQLAQRYFRERDLAAEAAASITPELDSLRKEVSSLREALTFALRPEGLHRSPRITRSSARWQWLRVRTAVQSLFYNHFLDLTYVVDVCMEPIFWVVDNFTKFLGPFFVVAVCGLTASVVVIAYWIGLPYWWTRSPTATVILMVVGNWLLVNVCFHYYMGTVTSPGFPPEGSLIPEAASICKKCIAPKPPRTHHCSVCNRCILKMDHHCPWLNNCVGHYNHRYFFLYMVYVVAGVLFLMVFGVEIAYEEVWLAEEEDPPIEGHPVRINDTMLIPVTEMNVNASLEAAPPPQRSVRRNCIIFAAFITTGVFVALGSLALWHARLIGRGETSIEANINKAETKRLAARNKVYINPYDLGRRRNWRRFLGLRRGRGWVKGVLLPSAHTPFGAGLTWRTATVGRARRPADAVAAVAVGTSSDASTSSSGGASDAASDA